ncbi:MULTISPECIES: HPr family phosphocarrier protein [Kitasatospora]|uniref:Phosphocarrier protein HPr n=1 Tax=Kitasatospora cathayae TaxID=3004092 RepID=A0ABY7PYR6_9ACTN|nr:HPr family phosphocarrier protein [Kitasatospora sp. HUAS 3-15]WBP85527.1 HPr family phosphocarrier protein [Kitasatospora sp. HUAS 3-15]
MSSIQLHSLQVAIGSRSGLHARPASQFVQAAARQPVKVTVGRPGQPSVDARSLLSVLALAARAGEVLELSAEGEQAREAVAALAEVLAADHDAAA